MNYNKFTQEYHVSPGFAGLSIPFFSCIQKAIDFAYVSDTEYPAIRTVIVHGGVYRIDAPIILKHGIAIVWLPGVELIPTYGDTAVEFFNDGGKDIIVKWDGTPYMNNMNQGSEFNFRPGTYFYQSNFQQENLNATTKADLEMPFTYQNKTPENILVNFQLDFQASVDAVHIDVETDMDKIYDLDYPAGFEGSIPFTIMLQAGGTLDISGTGTTLPILSRMLEIGYIVTLHAPVV